MHRRLLALLLCAGTFVPVSGALAAVVPRSKPAPGGIGIGLVALPSALPLGALGQVYVVDHLAPGKSVVRRVEIINSTRTPARVEVYPAAAAIVRGHFEFASGQTGNDLASWISLSSTALVLAPGSKGLDTLTIRVPAKASSGEDYAVVWAQVSATPGAVGGIRIVNRVGMRIYISVGRGGAPPSNFTIGSLAARRSPSGQPMVVTTIHNTGHLSLDISGSLTLSNGPGGLSAGPFAVRLASLVAPGYSEALTVALDAQLPRGPWQAHLSLTSGQIQRSAVGTITFPRLVTKAGTSPAKVASASFPALSLVAILLLLMLTVTLLALRAARRRISGLRRL